MAEPCRTGLDARIQAGSDDAADAAALAQLPDDALARQPWARYALGWRLIIADELGARRQFTLALDAFERSGDRAGCRASAAAMLILTADRHADFRGLARWCEQFRATADAAAATPLLRLREDIAHLVWPELAPAEACDPVQTARSIASAHALLHAAAADPARLPARPVEEWLLLARQLLDRHGLDSDATRFHRVAAFSHGWLRDPQASAYWRAVFWWRLALHYADFGDAEAARTSRAQAWSLAETCASADLEAVLLGEDVADALAHGDLIAAGRRVARLAALAPRLDPVRRAQGFVHTARLHLQRGEPVLAADLCLRALALYAEQTPPGHDLSWPLSLMAHARIAEGRENEAIEIFERIRPHQQGGQLQMLEALVALAGALRALRRGEPGWIEHVRDAWRRLRELDWQRFFITLPGPAAALCAAALAHGIEREFVVRTVRVRSLPPPDSTAEGWPWMVRVRALGGFAVEREDQPIAFERKAQKKPLELLKALVAAGGHEVPRETLAHALWPDPASDALQAFDVTLSRLRKLIGVDAALQLEGGRLSLNRRIVWCDVWAFETLSERADPAAADEALRLYRGGLFGDDAAMPWSAAPRDRLAARHGRLVAASGAALERQGRWSEAIACYERGLARQVLAEPFYRGLMRCHIALGEPTEAMLAFRRCRDLLAQVLGLAPSRETLDLLDRLRAGETGFR